MLSFLLIPICHLFGITGANAQAKKKLNIRVIFGDDMGYWNLSAYNRGMMGYRTPIIDRIAKEGHFYRPLISIIKIFHPGKKPWQN